MKKEDATITITLTQEDAASILTVGAVMIKILEAMKIEWEKQELDVQDEIDRIFKPGDSQQ